MLFYFPLRTCELAFVRVCACVRVACVVGWRGGKWGGGCGVWG